MALLRPLYLQAAEGDSDIAYTAQMDRAGLLGAVFSREGVLDRDAGHLRVTQRGAGPSMSVDVAGGYCAIRGDDISDQGTYVCLSTTPKNITVPPAPASGSRQHRVVAQVRDKLSNGQWATYDWIPSLLPDTGTGMPAEPPSAITLAYVTVPAGTGAITTAMCSDQRRRASVGTPAVNGTWIASGVHSAYGVRDGSRPLTWSKNPDGWVFLGGWLARSAGNTAVAKDATYFFDGVNGTNPVLPAEARPTGVRDFIGLTSNGYCHLAVYPSGALSFRFNYPTTLVQNQTWFTFDDCSFRANSF